MKLLYFGIAWAIGLLGAAYLDLTVWPLGTTSLWGLIAGIFLFLLAWFLRQYSKMSLFLFLLGAMVVAGWRYNSVQPILDEAHIAFFNGSEHMTVTGLAASEPIVQDRRQRVTLTVEDITLSGAGTRSVTGKVVVFAPRLPVVPYGAQVQVTGSLQPPPEFDTFNYRAYLARQGVHSVVSRPRIVILQENAGNPLLHTILNIKGRAQATINTLIPEPSAALLSGILLGNEAGLPALLQADFRTTGMTHIIAISGFNISILAAILLALLEPIAGKRMAPWLTIIGLVAYTVLVGANAAVVRAAIMGGIYVLGSRVLGRPNFNYASLFAAGIFMTAWNPFTLWDVGFQLSFMATLGLMLYADRFSRRVRKFFLKHLSPRLTKHIMGVITEGILITVAAQITTLPLMIVYFEQLSLASLIANPLILPVQPQVMIWGGVATIIGMASPLLGQPIAWAAWIVLRYTIFMVQLLAKLPLASVPLRIDWGGVLLLYVVIAGISWLMFQEKQKRIEMRSRLRPQAILTFGILAVLLAASWHKAQPDGLLHVHFLDVGQGDAAFIQTPSGRQLLLDAGISPTLINEHIGRLMPFYDRSLDMVIATHADIDHIAGMSDVLSRYHSDYFIHDGTTADASLEYVALLETIAAQGVTPHHAIVGEVIDLGDGVKLEVLNSGLADGTQSDNNRSVALRLVYGDLAIMLTGDAEKEAEQAMTASGANLQAQVYKVGHHGSSTSSTEPFLLAMGAQIGVISAGIDNNFGHPHQEILERLTAHGITILRTDKLGSIELISDGRQMWWQAYGAR